MRVQNKILTSGFSFLLFVVQTAFPAEWVNESISVNDATYVSKRPVLEKRAFVSSAVAVHELFPQYPGYYRKN